MARNTDSRSRMVHAAGELFRQRGYHATAFSNVVEESGAPRGSIYFHFPGGKQELARETTARAADEIEDMVHKAASRAHDPVSLIQALAEIQVQRLEASGYCSGCAIATMVLELAPQDEQLSAEFDKVFTRWRTALVDHLRSWSVSAQHAVALADLIMAVFEGALVLSRAARSSEPFWSTIQTLIATAGCLIAEPQP